MTTATFTLVHVLISLAAIVSGWLVVYGMLRGNRMDGGTAIFLLTTALTSLTGFFFPSTSITPGFVLGVLSLVVLAAAIVARYLFHMAGAWRWVYVVGACVALYFNMFVLLAQLFMKVPVLHALAPTGKELPFGLAQLALLVLLAVVTVKAVQKFHLETGHALKRAA
jgi:hypothetical protein